MARINIEFTLFSAFYSPLISVMSGGFLRPRGWKPIGQSRRLAFPR
jgi:NitT/TauT family transport system substrate-binding protein